MMAKLRKGQHEDFYQFYTRYPNAGEAAHHVGYSYEGRHQQGYRLLRRPEVTRRIGELREELARRECMELDALLAKLEASYAQALSTKNPLAAVRVVEAQARLCGLMKQRDMVGAARTPGTAAAAHDDTDAITGTIVADETRFAQSSVPSEETTRAALAAVARASARRRSRASS
jgi:phage terminase small subunit